MIIILKPDAGPAGAAEIEERLSARGASSRRIEGSGTTVLGLVGDTSAIPAEEVALWEGVARVVKVQEPYKLAGRAFHPEDTVVRVGGRQIGGSGFSVIAGPCSVESEEQVLAIARDVKQAGAAFLRGGAFKPRTSPYAFQGLGLDGLELLKTARQKTGLPVVSEILSPQHLDAFARDMDIIQIGARNMQNFQLLREVGRTGKPVLLKRGLSSTVEELLMAAEHILVAGKSDVILCERGIRTFETATRNTLDLSAVPVLKRKTHLPVLVDPSHSTGDRRLVGPMSLAAAAAGADGLMIEVHNHPERALCDGPQSITPASFAKLMRTLSRLRQAIAEEERSDMEVPR